MEFNDLIDIIISNFYKNTVKPYITFMLSEDPMKTPWAISHGKAVSLKPFQLPSGVINMNIGPEACNSLTQFREAGHTGIKLIVRMSGQVTEVFIPYESIRFIYDSLNPSDSIGFVDKTVTYIDPRMDNKDYEEAIRAIIKYSTPQMELNMRDLNNMSGDDDKPAMYLDLTAVSLIQVHIVLKQFDEPLFVRFTDGGGNEGLAAFGSATEFFIKDGCVHRIGEGCPDYILPIEEFEQMLQSAFNEPDETGKCTIYTTPDGLLCIRHPDVINSIISWRVLGKPNETPKKSAEIIQFPKKEDTQPPSIEAMEQELLTAFQEAGTLEEPAQTAQVIDFAAMKRFKEQQKGK